MIKVAIVGVGNCTSSLIQGKYFYELGKQSIGLLRSKVGKYRVKDIQFVAAFDIDKNKVGLDLSKAILIKPNNAFIFQEVPFLNVPVLKGHIFDGIANHMVSTFHNSNIQKPVNIAKELKKAKADILINFLPVGSKKATEFYASEAIKARVAFINAIPEFICSNKSWEKKFIKFGIPCAGDDIKSQIGATILNRVLTQLIYARGCTIENMYQINIGGNSDFKNMIEEERLITKRISKTNSVLSVIDKTNRQPDVKIGPSEFIPHLLDRKICYINIRGKQFGALQYDIDLKLSVEDSPNSAGIMIDVIRLLKIAKDNNRRGNIEEINAFAFKSPSVQIPDGLAMAKVEAFIKKHQSVKT